MKSVTVLCCTLLITMAAWGQPKELVSGDDASRLTDDIMMVLETENVDKSMKIMKKYMAIDKSKSKTMTGDLESLLKNSKTKHGKMIGTSFVKKENVGKFLVRYTHVLLYEEQPVWVRFTYYKSGKTYTLKNVDWGEDLNVLF
jgi:sulfatase maturation enzyme AslB (radical SAM superfamily)